MKLRTPEQFPPVNNDALAAGSNAAQNNTANNDASLPDVIITTDTNFKVTGWNEAAEKNYALPLEQGKNFFDIFNSNFCEASIALMQKRFKEDGTWNSHIKLKNTEGDDIYFRSAAYCITASTDTPAAIVITNHNITTEIIAAQKLAESEAMCKLLIDKSAEGILLIGATGRIMSCNKKATEILSLSEEHLKGKIPVSAGWKVFRPDGKLFPDCELPAVVSLQTGFPQKNIEMRLEKDTGQSVWLCISSQALVREGEFNPYAVLVSFEDITPHKISSYQQHSG
jgi:PAS domain-containing protein